MKLGDDVVELHQWDAVRIAPETMRCVEGGSEGIELVAYGAPSVDSGDVEMTPGWWSG